MESNTRSPIRIGVTNDEMPPKAVVKISMETQHVGTHSFVVAAKLPLSGASSHPVSYIRNYRKPTNEQHLMREIQKEGIIINLLIIIVIVFN